jgi:hypothetical protein
MNKYQIVVLRKLKSFGQFVTESRDEVNTYEFGEGDERPIIFGEKLKAVERRTIMRKTREVLGVNCWLTTSKKGADAGISGLCLSCPACALFGGTYAPKKGGTGGPRNAIEMRRVYYSGAFPFKGEDSGTSLSTRWTRGQGKRDGLWVRTRSSSRGTSLTW